MPSKGFDFAGYATRNDVRCTDGTIIRQGCFHNMDGKTVPLVYQHNHNSIGQVLGHCELEETPHGIYCYAYCNDTDAGRNAKEAVQHGDINAFSIWANNLKRNANDILHGTIREVSLVLSGADKSAVIDTIVAHGEESEDEAEIQFLGGYADMMTDEEYYLAHSDEYDDEEYYPEDQYYLDHADEDDTDYDDEDDTDEDDGDGKTIEDVVNSMNKDQRAVLNYMVGMALKKNKGAVAHADDGDEMDEDTVEDVINSMSDKQRNVMNYVVGLAIEKANGSQNDEDEDDYSDEEEDEMKHNAFEDYGDYPVMTGAEEYISHDELMDLMDNSTSFGGSLAKTYDNAVANGFIQHDDTDQTPYGIDNIDYLFPDARTLNAQPDFISRNMDWVDKVLAAVHRTPFSRVKSIHADITADEARAKGYIKGDKKLNEVLTLLQRVTEPQTVFKKQTLDNDDIDDITSFDIIAWLKAEMQVMLREEIARAILIGDGRETSDRAHIKEDHIRPIVSDDDLYTVKFAVEIPANATDEQKSKALLKALLKARKLYKGTGTPTFYTTEDELTNVLLLENGIGERMYKSENEVATAMRVGNVQTVEPMSGLKVGITDGGTTTQYEVAGIEVNLTDYNIGTNGGAKTNFFDDFDLNYNQKICLYETRLSGAMVKPYGAVCFYYKPAAA